MPVNNAQQNRSWLNSAVLFLCIIQPCLDVISYWMDIWRADNTVTLALRFVLLIMVIACAWSISEHKRVYAAATLCSVLLIAGLSSQIDVKSALALVGDLLDSTGKS